MASKKGRTKSPGGSSSANVTRQDTKSPKSRDGKVKDISDMEPLAYKVLSEKQTKQLFDVDTVDDLERKVMEMMSLENSLVDLKDGALLDIYTSALWWSREQSFSIQQTSAFFTVIHTLLENIKEKQMSLVENLKEYKNMLVGVGPDSSESTGGLGCFDIVQAKAITDYVYLSIFQHYKLFEFIFSHTQAEEIIGADMEVEVAKPADRPWPPPLDEAVKEEIYEMYIKTPPPTPQLEEGAKGDGEELDPAGVNQDVESREADILSQLSPEECTRIMDEVFNEMLGGLKEEVASHLRDKENAFINRINKIHNLPE